jgi:hypothetical protein
MMSKFNRECEAFLVAKIEVHVLLFKVPDTRHKGSVHLWRSGGTVAPRQEHQNLIFRYSGTSDTRQPNRRLT